MAQSIADPFLRRSVKRQRGIAAQGCLADVNGRLNLYVGLAEAGPYHQVAQGCGKTEVVQNQRCQTWNHAVHGVIQTRRFVGYQPCRSF